nr:MAG TPA: hypothetical protein [Caudoviricetes sp.]
MHRLRQHPMYARGISDDALRRSAAQKCTHKKGTRTGSRQSEHHRKKDILCLL